MLSMEERIKIIDSYRSVIGNRQKKVERRQTFLLLLILGDTFVISVAFLFTGLSIYADFNDFNKWSWNSPHMGLIILLSLGNILRWNPLARERRLLKTRQMLENHPVPYLQWPIFLAFLLFFGYSWQQYVALNRLLSSVEKRLH